MTVHYEWDVEEIDEHGDIVNHLPQTSYADCVAFMRTPSTEDYTYMIVLVRDDDKMRSWASVEDGKLSEYFSDAFGVEYKKVPKRFIEEVSNANID